MEARKNCCENFNRDIPLYWLSGGEKKKIKNASSVINVLFEKKEEEREEGKKENTGDIVIPGMDGGKKAGGCCFRKSGSFRMVAQGRERSVRDSGSLDLV